MMIRESDPEKEMHRTPGAKTRSFPNFFAGVRNSSLTRRIFISYSQDGAPEPKRPKVEDIIEAFKPWPAVRSILSLISLFWAC